MTVGADAPGILEQCRLTGRTPPPEIRACFDVWPASRPFLRLFQELHEARDTSAGLGGVCVSAIRPPDVLSLARLYGVDRRLAWRFVHACDVEYRRAVAESQDEATDETTDATSGAAPSNANGAGR